LLIFSILFMDFDLPQSDSEEVPDKSYLTQLREALDVITEKLLRNREKQRVLRECVKWERTYVSPDLLLPWFEDSFQNSPNLNVCDKKPVFHQLKKFSREEVQHLKSGIAGLWALQKLSKGANSVAHEVKIENEMPWDEVAQILPDRTTTEVKLKWLNELDPRLRKPREPWTTDELHKLESAVKKYNQREWIKVAKEVTCRTPLHAYQKWQERHRKELLNVDWSIDEDNKMRELVYKHGEKEWKLIASEMPKRSPEQLLHRWTRTSNPNIVHGRWTPEDDFKLIVMMRYLTGDKPIDKKDKTQIWCTAASIFPHKTDRKVRERWCNVIDCEKKEFTPHIDNKIMDLVKNRFNGTCRGSEISKILGTGHTGAQINRRFKKLNKARQKINRINKANPHVHIREKYTRTRGRRNETPEVTLNELTESDYGDSDDEYVPPAVAYSLRKKPRASRKRPRTGPVFVKTEDEPSAKRFCKTPERPVPAVKPKETSNVTYPISPDLTDPQPRNVVQPSNIDPVPGEVVEPSLI